MTAPMQTKKELRKKILSLRRSLPHEQICQNSGIICSQILASPVYRNASCVMAFVSMADEVQTREVLIDALAAGKKLCIPYITDLGSGIMQAAIVDDLSMLVPDKLGILSVAADKARFISPAELDLIIVPGVAFSNDKHRLGMGSGFYDRFLPKAAKAVKAGAFFSIQKVSCVPTDKYDFPLDMIFTENELLK